MREPITLEELSVARPLEHVRPWVENVCARYKASDWSDYFLARRGLANKIQGELIPLAHLCYHITSHRKQSQLKYFPGSAQSFDAQVLSADGLVQEVLEVTLACDGYSEAIAVEYLKEYGWAPLWSPLACFGKRGSRELKSPEMRSLDTEKIVEDGLTLIRSAVKAKSTSGKYRGVNLVVGFDEFRFLPCHINYVKAELKNIESSFEVVYYVGLDGRFFCEQHTGT